MKTTTEYLWFTTKTRQEFIRITDEVAAVVRKSGVTEGNRYSGHLPLRFHRTAPEAVQATRRRVAVMAWGVTSADLRKHHRPASIIVRTRSAIASIVNGLVMICMPGSSSP